MLTIYCLWEREKYCTYGPSQKVHAILDLPSMPKFLHDNLTSIQSDVALEQPGRQWFEY